MEIWPRTLTLHEERKTNRQRLANQFPYKMLCFTFVYKHIVSDAIYKYFRNRKLWRQLYGFWYVPWETLSGAGRRREALKTGLILNPPPQERLHFRELV